MEGASEIVLPNSRICLKEEISFVWKSVLVQLRMKFWIEGRRDVSNNVLLLTYKGVARIVRRAIFCTASRDFQLDLDIAGAHAGPASGRPRADR